jgi:putative hemolysin
VTTPGWFWIAVAAMAVGALFSTLFHSRKDMARTTLEEIVVRRRNSGASRRVERILEDPNGHSTAVALPRIVCNMVFAVAVVFWVEAARGELSSPTIFGIVIGIAAASIMVWIFGLVIPHSISMYAAEQTVYAWSWLIRASYIVQKPLNKIVELSDEVVRRLAGKTEESEAQEIEAELMSVIEEAQEEGQFDQVERDMIEAVVDFRSTTVEQIMTPRTEVEALELTNNLGEITRFISECRHSRIPVYEGSLDHVVGMFYIKDLMRWLACDGSRGSGKPFELKSILRPALFVPESKTIRELLQDLVKKKVHVAMVADEYGGTAGLVTLEDIVEEIFGEIQDEYEQTEDDLPEVAVSTDTRTAEIDGRAYIHDSNDRLRELGVELPEGEEYDTVGGLVVTSLGRIPAAGETVRVGELLLTVVEAEPTRVARVRLEILAPEAAPTPAPEPEGVPAGRRDDGAK